MAMLDVARIREDFPILKETVHGKPLVFLDSAASAQKPQVVIDAMAHFYAHEYANIHRGVYHLSALATKHYEGARKKSPTGSTRSMTRKSSSCVARPKVSILWRALSRLHWIWAMKSF